MSQPRRRKRVGATTAPDNPTADAPNRVWAGDVQFDSTTDGRPVKIVSIVDEHTRECLGGLVERSITGERLIDELDRLAGQRGYPAVLRCDDGPELACTAMADWAHARVVISDWKAEYNQHRPQSALGYQNPARYAQTCTHW